MRRTTIMHIDTLDILRCPYCGGRLELVTSLYHRTDDDEIHDGILGCHCCIFPVVDGHPGPAPAGAGDRRRASTSRPARRTSRCGRCSGSTTTSRPARFDAAASSDTRDLPGSRRGARSDVRGRLLPLPLLRSDLRRRQRRRAGRGRHGAARRRPRDRRLRRLGPPDAVAPGSVVAGAGARRSVSSRRSGWRAASPRRAASRSAATATRRCRSRAARSGTRCARTRFSTSGRSGSSSGR